MKKNIILLFSAFIVMAVIMLLPSPPEIMTDKGAVALSLQGKASLAVLVMVVILWVTEAVPFPIAGLIGMVLMVMTGASGFKEMIKEGFGNEILLFFIGVMIFSAAIEGTNLMKRLATYMLYHLGHKPKAIILVFLAIGAALSGWITDMAVAAMMLPIGVAILKDAGAKPLESNFGKALMISCAWGALIGGIATPAGCGPNPLTMAFLKDLAGVNFTFIDWMILGVPAAVMMVPCAWGILLLIFPLEKINLTIAEDDFKKRMSEFGPVSRQEIFTLVIFALTVFLWVCEPWIKVWTDGKVAYLSISFVAAACACLFFLPGINVISWKKAESEISWGGIILITTGLALGMAVYNTGAAAWLAQICFSRINLLSPIVIIFVVVLGVSIIKALFSSNTVTGIIMVPLLIALAKNTGLDPVLVAIPAGITSSLAFILVTSTPTNVIPYSSGYFTIRDMAKAGIWMTVASCVCVTISLFIFGRIFGIVKF
ncbi:MAG: hypothetical protein A2017_21955 [Lentisphaerae bacterium GWF2_44_16]|nr:MAG: hypothetical protein A2017_21955 [Lentisphaerae bacterium GWF2_44_16]